MIQNENTRFCKRCKIVKDIIEFNKSHYCNKCKIGNRASVKKYRLKNIDLARKRGRDCYYKYRVKNIERTLKYQRNKRQTDIKFVEREKKSLLKYQRKKRKNDPFFKLKCNLRTSIYHCFRNIGINKPRSTEKLLGVSFEIAKQHIERQFKEGMNWGNYGKWQIDHKIPLDIAKTLDEMMVLCHYKNLQPLWAIDNRLKSNKILPIQTFLTI